MTKTEKMNPMANDYTRKELMCFAIETLAHNLIADGLTRDDIPFATYVFQRKLCSFFEKPEFNQTS